jgi:hypothetical protein
MLREEEAIDIEFRKTAFRSCKSRLYPDGNPFNKVIAVKRFPATSVAFDLINSKGSGFFLCGMALDVDANLSAISKKPNSWVDQIMISSAILLSVTIRIESADINSSMVSLDEVASIELVTSPWNPRSDAVLFLLMEKLDPPTGPVPRGDLLMLE